MPSDTNKKTKSKATIAIILNATVLPGCGHWVLGQRIKGTIIGLVVIFLVTLPLVQYSITLLSTIRGVTAGGPAMQRSIQAISESWTVNRNLFYICIIGIAILWIYGILDIYLIKRRMDKIAKGDEFDGMQ